MVEQQLEEWLEEGYVASFRTACLILGNRADAEEAVQDAFLRAWRFRNSLSGVPSIRPWLYRVVVNSCYSKLRSEIPHRDRRADDGPLAHLPEPVERGADPELRAERSEVAETVLAALQRLPVSLRVPACRGCEPSDATRRGASPVVAVVGGVIGPVVCRLLPHRRVRSLHDLRHAHRWHLEGRRGLREQCGQTVVVEHRHRPASSRVSPASPTKADNAGSCARRRRASCRRDLTVPWRRPMASAMSRSLRSA